MSVLVSFTDEDAHAHLFEPDPLDVARQKIEDARQLIHWMPELSAEEQTDAAISAANLLSEAMGELDEIAARVPAVPLGGCDR